MIKDSFKTVFKHPIILIGFFIPALLIFLCYLPSVLSLADMEDIISYAFPIYYFFSMLLFFLVSMLLNFLILPVLYNYVYEAAQGDVAKGWFKRGLKRSWWKLFVTSLIATIPLYIFYFIAFFGAIVLIILEVTSVGVYIAIGIFLLVLVLFWITTLSISYVSVVAEKDYGEGLKNIFRIGFKFFFKVMLTEFICVAVGLLLSSLFILYLACQPNYLLHSYNWIHMLNNPAFIAVTIFALLLSLAANSICMSFLYVYTNKLYIQTRSQLQNIKNNQIPANNVNLEVNK